MQVQMRLLLVPYTAAHLHWCWLPAVGPPPPRTVRQCLRAGCRREPRPTPDCPAVPAADSLTFKHVEAESHASQPDAAVDGYVVGAQCFTLCNSLSLVAIDALTVQVKCIKKQATRTVQKQQVHLKGFCGVS